MMPEKDAPEEGARNVADTSEHRGDEGLEARGEPHLRGGEVIHRPYNAPPSAPMADPMRKVMAMTRLTLTPMRADVRLSWAEARMARPILVRLTNRLRAIMAMTVIPTTNTWK